MKKLVNLITASLFSLVLLSPMAYADKWKGEIHKSTDQPKPAFCVPASGSSELNLNNVRCRINTGGNMWTDAEVAKYEIPKGSRKTSMFSAALWIGGLDVNGQLKLAALRYRQVGNDYWTGPLTIDGTASIDQPTCKAYDKQWKITRAEVELHNAHHANPNLFPNYQTPRSILDWPAHPIDGNLNQSYYLAPFCDVDGDYAYTPENGDYPYYDFSNELCPTNPANMGRAPRPSMDADTSLERGGVVKGGMLVDQVLKGDQTIWWVFNDKGAAHTESKGEPIGLEIRAQAFAFATNDEINNMTFYSYEIINRSTYTLTQTYFSQWVDTDLGYAYDDFVGCDVARGLGYCYNGVLTDGTGKYNEYGTQPPAVGVDFFQGPYMDPDGYDNPNIEELNTLYGPSALYLHDGLMLPNHTYTTTTGLVKKDTVIVRMEAINGVNFGDGIRDNERFGMRRFVFHNNTGGNEPQTDPDIAIEYYNMLKGIWKDNNPMCYGGNAHPNTGGDANTPCAFMFPGDTDPWNWGTFGKNPGSQYSSTPWTEENAHNNPDDRRFMQSAGPFTLYPGAVNYITVGIPWARAASGGPFASVQLLRRVDDKCQILFDNCFKVLDGPDAPDLAAQELDKEVILYLTNPPSSNNVGEKYKEFDPSIPLKSDDSIPVMYDQYYHFEGYQIFQLSDASVSISDIYDSDKARLVFQCDLKNLDNNQNPIGQLVNYTYNDQVGGNIPQIMVQGGNEGIKHSVKITEDQFATGDRRLVNHKKYYYIAVSYAYNNYAPYSQDPNVSGGLNGQKTTYLAGRKTPDGMSIKPITVIPHIPSSEANGTLMQASYGDQPQITRVEGQGNGGLVLDLTQASIDKIMSGSPWRADELTYQANYGPLNIKVVDPLRVKSGEFLIKFTNPNNLAEVDSSFHWEISGGSIDPISSEQSIAIGDEQLVLDLGIAVQIKQFSFDLVYPDQPNTPKNVVKANLLESSITFTDPNKAWITGLPDSDGDTPLNWIRSGTLSFGDDPSPSDIKKCDYYFLNKVTNPNNTISPYKDWYDAEEQFEKVVNRTWAPYSLVGKWDNNPGFSTDIVLTRNLSNLSSVDIVLTPDKSKWTRCPVVETCDDPQKSEGHANKLEPRKAHSLDINGNQEAGYGMGWFPGYAINVETGERLNIMFGEDSWLRPFNGADMKFNPTSQVYSSSGEVIFGGKHFIYIMGHLNVKSTPMPQFDCPAYDEGAWLMNKFDFINTQSGSARDVRMCELYNNAMWVNIPLAVPSQEWLSNDVKIKIRVSRPYKRYLSTIGVSPASVTNDNFPLYKFNTTSFATETSNAEVAKSALDLINVVPNPYYGFSMYETNQLDNRIKIVNLPDKCTISIYSVSGSLVRQFKKDDNSITSLDWDLKNHAGIPISGGVYIIHVKADGIGERVIKWFGALRPTDLNSF